MTPLIRAARSVHMQASRNWLVTVYTAVVVTLILALAIAEAIN